MDIRLCKLFLIIILAECIMISDGVGSRAMLGNVKKEKVRFRTVLRGRGEVYENLFNLYDPAFLAAVWPKIANGVHLVLGRDCWSDVSVFFKNLSDGEAWAYVAVDASGRYQSGLFEGNRFWLGSKQECLELDSRYKKETSNETCDLDSTRSHIKSAALRTRRAFDGAEEEWRPQAQRRELVPQQSVYAPPFQLAFYAVQMAFNITKAALDKSYNVTLGVCLPKSCTVSDVTSILNFSNMLNDKLKSNNSLPRSVKVESMRRIEATYSLKSDIGALIIIAFTSVLVLLAVMATILDLDLVRCRMYHSKLSFDVQKYYKNNNDKTGRDRKENSRKDMRVDLEAADLNDIRSDNDLDRATIAKITKGVPPNQDVVLTEKGCKRCGKYRKQCMESRKVGELTCPKAKYNSFASLSTDDKQNSLLYKLLLCFSLKYSLKRIFNKNTANKNLSLVHCLKIFATFWIIFVHVAVIANYISEDAGDVNGQNNVYYIILTGSLAFDTLFFVSGLFSSHHFFYLKREYTIEELVSFGGICGQILQVICFVTNRAVRMLPSYLYMVFLTGILARVHNATSVLTLPEHNQDNCPVYWWRNLLYVNTFYPGEERCMQVSWYLSSETQFHALCVLLLTVGARARAAPAAALAAAALLAACALEVSLAYTDFSLTFSSAFGAYTTLVDRPWARLAPYFVGVFTGWLVHKMDGRLNGSKIMAWCLWAVSLALVGASLALPWAAPAWLSAWLRLAWPVALLWPVLVCSTKYTGACRRVWGGAGAAALSRLSYGALLAHGGAARLALLGADAALCSRTACIWWYFTGSSALALLAALLLALLVEMPCCSILRRLSDCAAT